jgi:hypothetical protein
MTGVEKLNAGVTSQFPPLDLSMRLHNPTEPNPFFEKEGQQQSEWPQIKLENCFRLANTRALHQTEAATIVESRELIT